MVYFVLRPINLVFEKKKAPQKRTKRKRTKTSRIKGALKKKANQNTVPGREKKNQKVVTNFAFYEHYVFFPPKFYGPAKGKGVSR